MISLTPLDRTHLTRGERVRQMVRLLLTCGAGQAPDDVKRYLRLCSHAERLKQGGVAVRIRGTGSRWLLEIQGGKASRRRVQKQPRSGRAGVVYVRNIRPVPTLRPADTVGPDGFPELWW